jgi:hypothetical protein
MYKGEDMKNNKRQLTLFSEREDITDKVNNNLMF